MAAASSQVIRFSVSDFSRGRPATRVLFKPQADRLVTGQSMDAESSVELLQRVRAGDSQALDTLLRRYVPALRRWARGRLPQWARESSETADLVQDAVLKTLQRLDGFEYRHEGALQAYLRQAVMNCIRDECRKMRRRPRRDDLDESTLAGGVSPLEAAITSQGIDRYEAGLARLRDDDRDAIVARLEMGCSYAEVAVMLGKTSADAARVAASRALLRLAEVMRDVP